MQRAFVPQTLNTAPFQSELQYLQPSSSRSIVDEKLTFVSTCCFLAFDAVQIKYAGEQSSVIKTIGKQETRACFAPFFIYFDMEKKFRNGGLNPFQKHGRQTPIPLRYITGIELN